MTAHEYYYKDRFGDREPTYEGFTDCFWEIFRTYLERYPTHDISVGWASGDPKKMFSVLLRFANNSDRMESLEFSVGDLVRVRESYAKSAGKLAVVTDVRFSGVNDVRIKTEDGATLTLYGRYLEKSTLPEELVNMAMASVKARMTEKCPMKEGAPCLS